MPIAKDKLVFLDLETTGGNASRHRIIEVGLLEVCAGTVEREWSSFVDPGCVVPPFIQNYTGISQAMLEDAPRFEQLADELLETFEGAVLVAHNARFDYGFLRNEFRRLGKRFRMPVLCTVKLARALEPGHKSYSLDALIARHGLNCQPRHRALGDARAMHDFFEISCRQQGEAAVQAAADVQLRRPTLPAALDPSLIDRLPEAPGVYLFHDSAGRLLYVGKSVNLRTRVLAHFSADHALHKEMRISAQLADIRWIETAGELGALLAEARLIKQEVPVHNRRLRRQNSLFTWQLDTRGEWHRPVLGGEAEMGAFESRGCFGLFRNRRAAKIALRKLCASDGLCPVRCGLEKGDGPCFAYQLGRCRGACAGRESPTLHNLRLSAALAALRITAWPFQGVIGLRETDEARRRQDLHLFENWCWLGTAEREQDIEALLADRSARKFDLDVYRILRGWLERKANRCEIINLDSRFQVLTSSA